MTKYTLFAIIIALCFLLGTGCSNENTEPNTTWKADTTLNSMDSLLLTQVEFPKITNYANFDTSTIKMFHDLATGTDGELYLYEAATEVISTLVDLLETHTTESMDLCLLIDKTGSMQDDLVYLRNGVDKILSVLEQRTDVRVAIGFYGDKNVDGRNWLAYKNFSTNFPELKRYFQKSHYAGGGDYPESITDAVQKMIQRLDWQSNTKRAILILGDAPSLLPPKAKYSVEQVIALAQESDIVFNYYPVVVGFAGAHVGPVQTSLITGLYPVPVQQELTVLLDNPTFETYQISIYNQSAQLVQRQSSQQTKIQFDLSAANTGLYIIEVLKPDGSQIDRQKFLVQR